MARYFFDFCQGTLSLHDSEGEECQDRHAVLERAGQILLEIAADTLGEAMRFPMSMSVRDEAGRAVGQVALRLVAEWKGGSRVLRHARHTNGAVVV